MFVPQICEVFFFLIYPTVSLSFFHVSLIEMFVATFYFDFGETKGQNAFLSHFKSFKV